MQSVQQWIFHALNRNKLYKLRLYVITLFVLINSMFISGCLESSFRLSDESRLPRWFSIPSEKNSKFYYVQMKLYSTFSGGEAIFELYEKDVLFPVQKFSVTSDSQPGIRCKELKSHTGSGLKAYPCYMVVKYNGITDIVELRKMEPVFYMTDDPAVWEELGVKQE